MAKRWFFTFKTFHGHTCQVDIYDENFSGTAIELNKDIIGSPGCPADNPLVIEEDDSDNILDNVRIKTGYINLIEITEGGLQDMYPSENGEFEVYAFLDKPSNVDIPSDDSDQYIIFHGFIQSQSFSQDYVSYRRKVKLPIQSVMGVLREQPITRDSNVIVDILVQGFTQYKYFVIPNLIETIASENQLFILMSVAQCILTPVNSGYDYGTHAVGDEEPEPTIPLTKEDFFKKLCNIFNLVTHDVGNMIVFTKLGYTGNYIRYRNTSSWSETGTIIGNGGVINTFSTLFDYSDEKSKISYIDSIHKLTTTWENIELPVNVNFSVASYIRSLANLGVILKYKGFEIRSNVWIDDYISNIENSVFIVGNEGDEYLESRRQSANDYLLQFWAKINYLNYANRIHLETAGVRLGTLGISILNSNGKYYNFYASPSEDDPWEDSEVIKEVTFSSISGGTADIDMSSGAEGEMTIFFYVKGNSCQIRFKKIELQNTRYENKYLGEHYNKDKSVIVLDHNAVDNVDVNYDFRTYGNVVIYPDFNHLKYSQRNLTLHVRKKQSISITELQLLIGKFATSETDNMNRVVSTRHYVRDDEYELQVIGNQYF